MSRTENIDNAIWDDPEFEALSPYATLLYLWSFTNRRCDMAGLYKVSIQRMTESKVPLDAIEVVLTELEAANFAFYESGVLWVRARVKRLVSRSPHIAKSIAKDLRKLDPEHPLRVRFLSEYGSDPWLREYLSDTSRESTETLSENPTAKGDSHTLPEPSSEVPLTETRTVVVKTSREDVDLPTGFPRELLPHLRSVFKVLRSLAERHDAKAVSPVALATVVMARPRKPLVMAAFDCAAHWEGRSQRVKNVVAAYRNWLDRTDDLAGIERLGEDGLPISSARVPSNGSHAGHRPNAAELIRKLEENERQMKEAHQHG